MLLDDQCYPTTKEIGLVELPLHEAARIYPTLWEPKIPFRTREHRGPLRDLLYKLLPLTSLGARRRAFVQTASRWTAYFDNGWRGTDAYATMSNMAANRCLAIRVVADPPIENGRRRNVDCPAVMWDVYDPGQPAMINWRRSIAAIDEGGNDWKFNQGGEPFPFEDTARYSARRIPDRFPLQLLLEYLSHFGIDLLNEAFYTGPAVIFEDKRGKPPKMREYPTFEAARQDNPKP